MPEKVDRQPSFRVLRHLGGCAAAAPWLDTTSRFASCWALITSVPGFGGEAWGL